MRRWDDEKTAKVRIEIIPMIDVMMFLLVFFVLISINVLPALGLKVALPFANNAAHLDASKRVTLMLTADGDIYLDGTKTSPPELADQLQNLSRDVKLTVTIVGDQNARLQPLVSVLDTLKRARIAS